jgi:hypothetical protein
VQRRFSGTWTWHGGPLLAVLVAIGAFLAWLISRHTLAAYLATASPEAALLINSYQPTALIEDAERQLRAELSRIVDARSAASSKSGPSKPLSRFAFQDSGGETAPTTGAPADMGEAARYYEQQAADADAAGAIRDRRARIADLASRALLADPVNARAYRVLSHLAELEGNKQRHAKLMRTAARLSLRDIVAVLWAMQDGYLRQDFPTTLKYADVMFRTQPQLEQYFVPMVARLAETPAARGELVSLLAGNPPWRSMFFGLLPQHITDARTPFNLLVELKTSRTPPTRKEVADYLRFLLRRNLHELAYYTWLQFLPAEQLSRAGYLFNGSFEQELTRSPFDWEIHAGSGVTVDIQPRPDDAGKKAVRIEFGHGRVEFGALLQLTMLPPGKYRFSGIRQGSLAGRRGLVWQVLCTQGSQRLGVGNMDLGIIPNWQPFSFEFTVPAMDCRTQNVMLVLAARSVSERLLTGSIFYDELEIHRTR